MKEIKILTLDTETYNGLAGNLKRIAVYDGCKVHYGYKFADVEQVINQYGREAYDVHVYIHNMEFDLRKIPTVFDAQHVLWQKSLTINRRFATLKNKRCTYHDSYKILPSSLASLSQDFEVEHGKIDLWETVQIRYPGQYKNIVDYLDRCDIDDPLYLEYLGHDVISLYEVLYKIMNLVHMPIKDFVRCVSTASLSRKIYKNGLRDKKFKNPRNFKSDYEIMTEYKWRTKKDLEIEWFLRRGYYGGRTEVFIPELKVPGYHYDINSQYPFVMGGDYPIGKPIFTTNPASARRYFEDWQQGDLQGLGFVNCSVYVPMQAIPPLPVQMGKLTFACGHIYGIWSFEELDYAVKHCGVVIEQYHASCYFAKKYPVFRNFINYFYSMKEEATEKGEQALRTLAKLIMNVGYGYTGMSREDKTTLDAIENADKYKEISYIDPELGFLEAPTEIKAEYIQVQIASTVTARARLVWLKAARSILNRGGRVYYGDTDSLVSDIPMLSPDVHPTRLGAWDLESTPSYGLYLKPKVYCEVIDGAPNVKFKGVTKETQASYDLPYYGYLYKLLQQGKEKEVVVEKNKLVLRGLLYLTKQGMDYSHLEYRDKKFNLQKDGKRIIDYNNNRSVPWYFATYDEFTDFEYDRLEREVEWNDI